MNRKQFLLVIVALGLIGGAGLVLLRQKQQSWLTRGINAGGKILQNFRPNDIAAIRIKGASEINIVKQEGVWHVHECGDYPANFYQVKELLMKMGDIKVMQSELVGPSQRGQVGLNDPGTENGATLLEFRDAAGNVAASLFAGKKHLRERNPAVTVDLRSPFDGRYVRLAADAGNVLLISDELASATPQPEAWLSRDFFKPDRIQDISLISDNPAESWELMREKESWPWTLVGADPGETLDTNQASQVAETLGFLQFLDVLPDGAPAASGRDKPLLMTVMTFDHFAYTFKIGARRADGTYPFSGSVGAAIPAERTHGENESPDERKKLDAQFFERARQLRDKLARETTLSRWIYAMSGPMAKRLVRNRAELLEVKQSAGIRGAGDDLEKPGNPPIPGRE